MSKKDFDYTSKLPYTITPRPEEEKPPKGKLWCPYCAKWSKFKPRNMGSYFSYPRSECCGISTEDFHVKTQNKLWNKT